MAKKLLASILAICLVLSTMSAVIFADGSVVAKVGETEYADINEAIENWTAGTTLTLLDDIQLDDVISLKSTEHHILNLGTYTMTAASGKNAIEIVCNGRSQESYCLTINADSTTPGGITAKGNACIYYRKTASTKDRPIITINGGVFNGSYSVNSYSSNKGTNCPQFVFNGGIFNNNVNLTNAKMRVYGGTFHGWVNCTGDSTAYRLIAGGTFKQWQFMTADSNNTKFWVGTKMAESDVGLYVDANGYLVVGGPVITEANGEFDVSTDKYNSWSSYLLYSSAATNNLYYKDAAVAFSKVKSGTVTLYNDSDANATVSASSKLTIDCSSGAVYSGDVKLNSKSSFEIILPENGEYNGTVTQYGTSNYLVKTEEIIDGDKVITYTQISDPVATGNEASLNSNGVNTMYPSFIDALADAVYGDTVTLYKDVTYNIDTTSDIAHLADDNSIVIDLNGNTLTPEDPAIPTFLNGETYIIKNGTIVGDVVNNGGELVINDVIVNGNIIINAGTADITGGIFTGSIISVDETALDVMGGKFTEDPAEYVPDGYDVIRYSDHYVVTNLSAEAKSISVEFEKTDVKNDEDNLEGMDTYNIVLKANSGDKINELASADLTFILDKTLAVNGAMNYTIIPAYGMTLTQIGDRYMFNYNGVDKDEESGNAIVIGELTIEGYGAYTFSTVDATTNIINATTVNDNLVDYYVKDGDIDASASTGGLDINTDTDPSDEYIGKISAEIVVPKRTLTVNVDFPNVVIDNAADYQAMTVTIGGGDLAEDIVKNLGSGTNANASYTVTEDLTLNTAYTVTVKGAGYRTARYTVTMTEAKTLNFWNNVKDNTVEVEEGEAGSAVIKNFLAGDIVADNVINIYDLSAAVSYFTELVSSNADYIKYDLNRDGVIDSKDVAYILVSWGE